MPRPSGRDEYRNAVTQAFLQALRQDGLEWKRMWSSPAAPFNGVSGRQYSGINRLMLQLSAASAGVTDPRWLTMTQIMDRDGRYHPGQKWHLQKGSKAVYVEFWFRLDSRSGETLTEAEYKQKIREGRDPSEFRLVPRYTAVFNASAVEGPEAYSAPPLSEAQQDEQIDLIAAGMGVPITYDGGDSAFYDPSADRIHLPERERFRSTAALCAVTLHELAHATGHPSRLARDLRGAADRENYAYEELVAEIASAFMGAVVPAAEGDDIMQDHKAYVNSWIRAIDEQPDTLMRAAKDAQRAADHLEHCRDLMLELQMGSRTPYEPER